MAKCAARAIIMEWFFVEQAQQPMGKYNLKMISNSDLDLQVFLTGGSVFRVGLLPRQIRQ